MLIKYKDYYPQVSKKAYIFDGAKIIGQVKLHDNVSVWFNTVIRGDEGLIEIHEDTNIQDLVTIHTAEGSPTVIGKGCTIGHNAVVHGCRVGDNTLIGINSVILDNATVGKNCIIGANSLVTSGTVIPDGSMAFGNPCKVVRSLKDEEIKYINEHAHHYLQVLDNYRY